MKQRNQKRNKGTNKVSSKEKLSWRLKTLFSSNSTLKWNKPIRKKQTWCERSSGKL